MGWAAPKDARRAAYMSIPWGAAIVFDGENRLYTVAKPLAIESISTMLNLRVWYECDLHHQHYGRRINGFQCLLWLLFPQRVRFLVPALSVMMNSPRYQPYTQRHPGADQRKAFMETPENLRRQLQSQRFVASWRAVIFYITCAALPMIDNTRILLQSSK